VPKVNHLGEVFKRAFVLLAIVHDVTEYLEGGGVDLGAGVMSGEDEIALGE